MCILFTKPHLSLMDIFILQTFTCQKNALSWRLMVIIMMVIISVQKIVTALMI